jgi:glycerol-3-phosphate dehydrogenase
MQFHKTQALIIGGGATGTGIARDLALRGVACILVERGDINAGASGSNHGLLHSGARYVLNDAMTSVECREENLLLKKLASHCVEDTGGMFVAIEGDDAAYIAEFPNLCARCGIPVEAIDPEAAKALEPELSDRVIAAYLTPDASVDPFKLSLENISHARKLGATQLCRHRVMGFEMEKGRICRVRLLQTEGGEEVLIEADQVINASGAWAAEIASLAGVSIPMVYSKGSLLVTSDRITQRVINRLRPPGDGDILVPGGTVSLLGTTSVQIDAPDLAHPSIPEIDRIVDQASQMIPMLESARYIRAYSGVRPLMGSHAEDGGRSQSRGFAVLDHEKDGLTNFVTISGGKLTTYRLMAEKGADLVCHRLGVSSPCLTRTQPLPASPECRWSEPGLSPKLWLKAHDAGDMLLCECEMVPKSVVEGVISAIQDQQMKPDLRSISLRSRIGKGPCQGAFCSLRVSAYLHDRDAAYSDRELTCISSFLRERWKGLRPVLWGGQLMQSELQEALQCGLLNLELKQRN